MTPRNIIFQGDCMQMKDLPDGCVHCVVTSPPYFNLRAYGIEPSEWPEVKYTLFGFEVTVPAMRCELGHEKDPKEFVGHIVHVFREVKRVLRDDGTLWLNFADSYSASGRGGGGGSLQNEDVGEKITKDNQRRKAITGYKPKDLLGIPWMVAFALRDDGWYLRMDNVWGKPNPMPESVTDRPTKSHEYIFLLSKSERYFYDADAIKTEPAETSVLRWNQDIENQKGSDRVPGRTNGNMKPVGNKYAWGRAIDGSIDDVRKGNGEDIRKEKRKQLPETQSKLGELRDKQRGHSRRHAGFNDRWDQMSKDEQCSMGANKRSVWMIPTQGFKEAHFATFPEKIPIICIKAGTSKFGVCAACGAPYKRTSNTFYKNDTTTDGRPAKGNNRKEAIGETKVMSSGERTRKWTETTGWQPTCDCRADVVPAIVLDPFGGSGTTMMIARKLGRDYIAYEMKPENVKMSKKRLHNKLGLFQ